MSDEEKQPQGTEPPPGSITLTTKQR